MPLGDENRAVFFRWRRSAGWPFFDNSSGAVGRLGRRADSAPAPGLRHVPRCEPSDGVSVCAPVRASGRGFGERRCPGFGRRGEKIRAAPFFDPIKRYFCREGCARAGIVCLFAGCRSAGRRRGRGVPRGTGLLRRRRGSSAGMGLLRRWWGEEVPRARAFCAGMRRGEEVPRGTGLLRWHAAGEFLGARAFCAGMRRRGSSAGHGPFAPACGGAGESPAELRASSVQRHARVRAPSGKTENRPKTEKNRKSTQNRESTEYEIRQMDGAVGGADGELRGPGARFVAGARCGHDGGDGAARRAPSAGVDEVHQLRHD